MGNDALGGLLHFLADRLDYLLLAAGGLLLFLLLLLFLTRKKKRPALAAAAGIEAARASLEEASQRVQALIAEQENRLRRFEEEEAERQRQLDALQAQFDHHQEALRLAAVPPEELQQALDHIREQSDLAAATRYRGGRFRMFLLGFLLGAGGCIGGYLIYANWSYLQTFLPLFRS